MALLETKKLSKKFGSLLAIREVDFKVEKGELRTIIGPNGAGKTTFFNLLCGILRSNSGQILFEGRDITGLRPHQVAKMGIARSFQITSIFPGLTVFENILIPAMHYYSKKAANKRSFEVLEHLGLSDHADELAGNLSHGDQRHLDIGIALISRPKLLLLDEPTSGIPSEESMKTVELIKSLKEVMDFTIIMIEHKMDLVLSVSDSLTVFHFGEKIAEGTPAQIEGNQKVQMAYLGGLTGEISLTKEDSAERETGRELLRVEGIHTFYGRSHVLNDVSLNVRKGEIVALLGRNGAGKTTTLRSILGLTPPQAGRILFDGEQINDMPVEKVVQKGISYVPADRRIFANLNILENLELPFFMKGIKISVKKTQVQRILDYFPVLRSRINHKGNRLSGGEQQMLAVGRGMLAGVKFMLLDEPSEGLAPMVVRDMSEVIRKFNREEGVTILLVDQNAIMALQLADRVYVMDKGEITYEGSTKTLISDKQLSQSLLGV